MLKKQYNGKMMKLVNEKTGEAVQSGQELTDFRGEKSILIDATAPRHSASEGKAYVNDVDSDFKGEYYVSCFGLKWVDA